MNDPISRISRAGSVQLVPVAATDRRKQYRYSRDMFYSLLIVTFGISLAVSWGVVRLFDRPVAAISEKIFSDELGGAWHRYIKFAALVVGVSGGVRIHELERYITSPGLESEVLALTPERWTLEIYRTIIQTLQSLAWMFLVVFVVALLAFVVVRGFELVGKRRSQSSSPVEG